MAKNFDSLRPESLTGPLAGFLKLRVGDYRIVYRADLDNKLLTILMVGHRREIINSAHELATVARDRWMPQNRRRIGVQPEVGANPRRALKWTSNTVERR